MSQEIAKLTKEYPSNKRSVFILDKAKLSRLVNIIEEKYKSGLFVSVSRFDIIMKNGKKMSVTDIDNILNHDNTIKNPISAFTLHFEDQNDLTNNNCIINYNRDKSKVSFSIDSINTKWANELYAEIDEQIERTFNASFFYSFGRRPIDKIANLIIAMFMIVFVLSMFIVITTEGSEGTKNYLTKTNIEQLLESSQLSKSTEDKINIIYNYHVIQLTNLSESKSKYSFYDLINIQILSLLLPVFIVIIAMFYLTLRCYPGSIFLWGDYEEYYNDILSRRKFVINAIVITLFVGIVGNFFVYGFINFFGKR